MIAPRIADAQRQPRPRTSVRRHGAEGVDHQRDVGGGVDGEEGHAGGDLVAVDLGGEGLAFQLP